MANGEFGLYLIAESVRRERKRKRLLSPTPTYTLDELKQLAREYVDATFGDGGLVQAQLTFSLFLIWLARREQGKGDQV